MIDLGIQIRYTGFTPRDDDFTQRQWNNVKRAAWEDCGMFWLKDIRPKHFTVAGAREYGYTPRSGEGQSGKLFWRSYTGRKQKSKGHTRPLVWSGELEELSKTGRITATATANRSHCKVALSAARKANFRHPSSRIDMADELTRASEADAKAVSVELDRRMGHYLHAVRDARTITIC
jgi:hypothetical protein